MKDLTGYAYTETAFAVCWSETARAEYQVTPKDKILSNSVIDDDIENGQHKFKYIKDADGVVLTCLAIFKKRKDAETFRRNNPEWYVQKITIRISIIKK